MSYYRHEEGSRPVSGQGFHHEFWILSEQSRTHGGMVVDTDSRGRASPRDEPEPVFVLRPLMYPVFVWIDVSQFFIVKGKNLLGCCGGRNYQE